MSIARPALSAATQAFLARRGRGDGLLIDGGWSSASATLATLDPATGDENGVVPRASASDVDAAVAAAQGVHRLARDHAGEARAHPMGDRRCDRSEDRRAGRAGDA